MWQPNRAQWATIWVVAVFLILAWPSGDSKSLGAKVVNWAVDPGGALPTMPPQLPMSLDDDGDLILMRRFLARYKPIFPNYRKKAGGEEAFRQAALAGWTGALPVSVFYARDGRQAGHVLGEGSRETYEAAIRSLLAAGTE